MSLAVTLLTASAFAASESPSELQAPVKADQKALRVAAFRLDEIQAPARPDDIQAPVRPDDLQAPVREDDIQAARSSLAA